MFIRKEWNITRVIDGGDPIEGRLKISCTSPSCYLWEEYLRTPVEDGEMIEGYQSYKVKRQGAMIEVFYATGPQKDKLFQIFDLHVPDKKSSHTCGDDLYESYLSMSSRKEIKIEHRVTGPSKNYHMKSRYFCH